MEVIAMKYNGYEDFYKVDERGKKDFGKIIILYNPKTHKELFFRIEVEEYKMPLFAFLLEERINYQVRSQWVLETKKNIDMGDLVKIVKGTKMVGKVKRVQYKYNYTPNGTYKTIPYLMFTDNTFCSESNCELWTGTEEELD